MTQETITKIDTISKDMTIGDAIREHPEVAEVLFRNGLRCVGCFGAAMETIEEGALAHGIDKAKIDDIIKEANEAIAKKK
jgi:hybrid cluster-associated redox disulfide protein